ncbi:hypothetical protein BDV95DRAFT_611804 [Massariosphaeria phaeospora]|uniref:Uncharacterized protein n=1 Tax=Massariosphaeria phaeospora TaxID=100035 RepID=A0A7C8I127_9PLEO|nr:hypothetical protein BDV95DRAFT_611804 [Massariosphaeria phaeospora]
MVTNDPRDHLTRALAQHGNHQRQATDEWDPGQAAAPGSFASPAPRAHPSGAGATAPEPSGDGDNPPSDGYAPLLAWHAQQNAQASATPPGNVARPISIASLLNGPPGSSSNVHERQAGPQAPPSNHSLPPNAQPTQQHGLSNAWTGHNYGYPHLLSPAPQFAGQVPNNNHPSRILYRSPYPPPPNATPAHFASSHGFHGTAYPSHGYAGVPNEAAASRRDSIFDPHRNEGHQFAPHAADAHPLGFPIPHGQPQQVFRPSSNDLGQQQSVNNQVQGDQPRAPSDRSSSSSSHAASPGGGRRDSDVIRKQKIYKQKGARRRRGMSELKQRKEREEIQKREAAQQRAEALEQRQCVKRKRSLSDRAPGRRMTVSAVPDAHNSGHRNEPIQNLNQWHQPIYQSPYPHGIVYASDPDYEWHKLKLNPAWQNYRPAQPNPAWHNGQLNPAWQNFQPNPAQPNPAWHNGQLNPAWQNFQPNPAWQNFQPNPAWHNVQPDPAWCNVQPGLASDRLGAPPAYGNVESKPGWHVQQSPLKWDDVPQPIVSEYDKYRWSVQLYELDVEKAGFEFAQSWLEDLCSTLDTHQWFAHVTLGFIQKGTQLTFLVLHNAANPFDDSKPIESTTSIGVYGYHWDDHDTIHWKTFAPDLRRLLDRLVADGVIREIEKWSFDMIAKEKRFHRSYWLSANMRPLNNLLNRERKKDTNEDEKTEAQKEVEKTDAELDGGELDNHWRELTTADAERAWERCLAEIEQAGEWPSKIDHVVTGSSEH